MLTFSRDGDTVWLGTIDQKPLSVADDLDRPETSSSFIKLNVGGKTFLTDRSTLERECPEGMLARMFSGEKEGRMDAGVRDTQGAYMVREMNDEGLN